MSEVKKDGLVLVHARTGKVVNVDDVVLDFRGEAETVVGGEPPHKPGSTGRVFVKGGEYYPSVFDLVWAEDKRT